MKISLHPHTQLETCYFFLLLLFSLLNNPVFYISQITTITLLEIGSYLVSESKYHSNHLYRPFVDGVVLFRSFPKLFFLYNFYIIHICGINTQCLCSAKYRSENMCKVKNHDNEQLSKIS